jgi:hypothetical protein
MRIISVAVVMLFLVPPIALANRQVTGTGNGGHVSSLNDPPVGGPGTGGGGGGGDNGDPDDFSIYKTGPSGPLSGAGPQSHARISDGLSRFDFNRAGVRYVLLFLVGIGR